MWQDLILSAAFLVKELREMLSYLVCHLALALRARTLNQMGDPAKPKASRI
jgi:hypothetical protein